MSPHLSGHPGSAAGCCSAMAAMQLRLRSISNTRIILQAIYRGWVCVNVFSYICYETLSHLSYIYIHVFAGAETSSFCTFIIIIILCVQVSYHLSGRATTYFLEWSSIRPIVDTNLTVPSVCPQYFDADEQKTINLSGHLWKLDKRNISFFFSSRSKCPLASWLR